MPAMKSHAGTAIISTDEVMLNASDAFNEYKKVLPEPKAIFLEAIANEIEALGDALINKASEETNLPAARLTGERARTTMQLRMFAAMVREGNWVEASIDTSIPDRYPVQFPFCLFYCRWGHGFCFGCRLQRCCESTSCTCQNF